MLLYFYWIFHAQLVRCGSHFDLWVAALIYYVMLCREKCSQLNPLLWTHTLLILSIVNVFAKTAAWGLWSEFWQIGGTVGLWGKTAGWHRACLVQSSHSISVTDICLYGGQLPPLTLIIHQAPATTHEHTCVSSCWHFLPRLMCILNPRPEL